MIPGFIKIWRKILGWEWYQDSHTLHLFLHLLLNANYKDSRYMGYDIKRGQIVTGRKKLAEGTGISEQTIRTSLERLSKTGEILINSTSKFSIITLCNYETYQDDDSQPNQQVTSIQPATNQQVTSIQPHPKKNKNNKKEKNKYKDTIFLTEEEYNGLLSEWGSVFLEAALIKLDGYISNSKKGSQYKDHNKVLRGWVFDEINKKLKPIPCNPDQIINEEQSKRIDALVAESKTEGEAIKKELQEEVVEIDLQSFTKNIGVSINGIK